MWQESQKERKRIGKFALFGIKKLASPLNRLL